jgi:transposase
MIVFGEKVMSRNLSIKPHFPTNAGIQRVDDGRVIAGIVHTLKSGCRWCDCPEAYGP